MEAVGIEPIDWIGVLIHWNWCKLGLDISVVPLGMDKPA